MARSSHYTEFFSLLRSQTLFLSTLQGEIFDAGNCKKVHEASLQILGSGMNLTR
jgi:hypothetical protein